MWWMLIFFPRIIDFQNRFDCEDHFFFSLEFYRYRLSKSTLKINKLRLRLCYYFECFVMLDYFSRRDIITLRFDQLLSEISLMWNWWPLKKTLIFTSILMLVTSFSETRLNCCCINRSLFSIICYLLSFVL